MQLSKNQEAELLKVYESWWNSYLTGDVKTYDSFLDDDYHFVGSTNGEEYLNRKDTTAFFNATADQLAGKAELRNLKRTIEELDGGLILITDVADAYVITEPKWVFYSRFRFTSLMKETNKGWRFIYQHFSAPDTKAQDGETLGTEQISRENRELRDAIKRRTIELEQKNRELEIEAALERVRSIALGMRKPDDLPGICEVLFTELSKLGFSEIRNVCVCMRNVQTPYQLRRFSLKQWINGALTHRRGCSPRTKEIGSTRRSDSQFSCAVCFKSRIAQFTAYFSFTRMGIVRHILCHRSAVFHAIHI